MRCATASAQPTSEVGRRSGAGGEQAAGQGLGTVPGRFRGPGAVPGCTGLVLLQRVESRRAGLFEDRFALVSHNLTLAPNQTMCEVRTPQGTGERKRPAADSAASSVAGDSATGSTS